MSAIIALYVKSLFGSYVTYMTGLGPIALDRVAQWSSKTYRQWAVEHGAFRRWIVVVVLLGGILWAGFGAFQQQYDIAQDAIANKATAISERDSAKAQSDERQHTIDRLSIQIASLQAQLAQFQNSQPTQTQRDPDGLYQLGQLVGRVTAAVEDRTNGQVRFGRITVQQSFNSNAPFDYRNFKLRITKAGSSAGGGVPGSMVFNVFDVAAEILGTR